MPNIGRLTPVLGVYEIACGVCLIRCRRAPIGACGMIAFLAFITVVGYGLPAASAGADFLENRLTTIVLALLLLPLVTTYSRWTSAGRGLRR